MQAFIIVVVLLCSGVAGTTAALVHDGLEWLPEDMLRHINSRLPAVDRFHLSLSSSYMRNLVDLNDADIISARLLRQFGEHECLVAAIHIEDAPPGSMVQVVMHLLRSTHFDDWHIREALKQAYTVGHCDLVDVFLNHLQTSRPDVAHTKYVNFDRASCDDVARLSSLPLEVLLKMHALPRPTFLQVLATKYDGSGYGPFFKDQAWNLQYYSNTVMSHLYEKLLDTVDFDPARFCHISSMRRMSEYTRRDLLDSSGLCRHAFSHLQVMISPGSEIEFFNSSSVLFRADFLLEACRTGRLDWVCSVRLRHFGYSCCSFAP